MRSHRIVSIAATVLLGAAALVGLTPHSASAAAVLRGAVSFSNSGGSTTTGGSGTVSMGVPAGSACQGSGSSGYRWETYLVSAGVDVAALTFSSGPNPVTGEFVVPLYDLNLLQVSTKFPAANPLGLISGIPAISFSNTVDGNGLAGLPVGTYKIGVACTYQGAVQDYWMTYLAVTANGSDSPLGIAWAVTTAPVPTTTSTTTSTTTTTSIAPGATTTTSLPPSSTTTTSTSVGAGATTTTSIVGSGGQVPAAGSSPERLVVWAVAALILGRMVLLSARRVKVLPPA